MHGNRFLAALGVVATGVGLYLLYRVLQHYDPQKIMQAIRTETLGTIAESILFTIGSFAAIGGMEILAIRHTGKNVSTKRIVQTSTAAIGIGHCIGLLALSSGAIRYRMYSRAGLDAVTVGEIVVFSGTTVALGLTSVGGATLLYRRDVFNFLFHVDNMLAVVVGFIGLASTIAYIVACGFIRGSFTVWGHRLRLPTWKTACAQAALGSIDLLCVAAVLYSTLRIFTKVDYPTVAVLYVGSDISALIGHVPGGWGVIEYIITQALHGSQTLAGILVFRTIYYLLPFAIGLLFFIYDELLGRRSSGYRHILPAAHGDRS
jgi:glycosyltransferase 2 family protein